MNFLLFATAWGPKHGGLNAFNRSLAIALAKHSGGENRVLCAVLSPDAADSAEAHGHGVSLIPLNKSPCDELDSSWVLDVSEWLEKEDIRRVDLCLGHDLVSGGIAIRAATHFGARSAIIHHMDYVSYHGAKGDPARTASLHAKQKKLFLEGDLVFGVGPKLTDSARRLTGRSVIELVPGLEDAPPHSSPNERVVAVTFGRFDASNNPIKQGRLAAAAFGDATRRASDAGAREFRDAPLWIVGLADGDEELSILRKKAETAAGRRVNLLGLPFDPNPGRVMERLASSNLAMVLSPHEGFGLTAWEAIAAETPLILSQNSGAYELLERDLGGPGLGCFKGVDIRAADDPSGVDPDDVTTVAVAIIDIARNISGAKKNAVDLRRQLIETGYTWSKAAEVFIDAVQGQSRSNPPRSQFGRPSKEKPRAVKTTRHIENALEGCVTIDVGEIQGSNTLNYDLTPEVRFGCQIVVVDDVEIDCGIRAAQLDVKLDGCEMSGPRLGDDAGKSPNIAVQPPSSWRINGPVENGLLSRKALGDERICAVQMAGDEAHVSLAVTCLRRDLDFKPQRSGLWGGSRAKEKMLKIFLSKCLTSDDGSPRVVLSRAVLKLRAHSE